jgi:hypothetical protein
MIPRVPDNKQMVKMLSDAIKEVYASVYYKVSKAYMTATANVIDEEKMGIVLQEVCGNRHGDIFYPTLSGVARSINYYPIGSEKAEDGIVNLAFGLGKLIVDGGSSLRFSPRHPKKVLQLTSPDAAIKETQKEFYAIDLNTNSFRPSTDDGVNLLKLNIRDIKNDGAMKFVASTYDHNNNVLYDGINRPGKRIITFSNILQHKLFPLADILNTLLEIGQEQMNNPIEIEFAANLETPAGSPKIFNFLQIRPIVQNDQSYSFNIDHVKMIDTIILSDSALGNGLFKGIKDLVYVKPDSFDAAHSEKIALDIEKINQDFVRYGTSYVLIGPGRWGSSDPWLGIPVKWPQISSARLIVESGLKNYHIDPSQGTHFFQNVTSFRVGYFTINPFNKEGYYDVDFLDKLEAVFEDDYVRHIRFNKPLDIMIDGKKHKGVIMKPVQ